MILAFHKNMKHTALFLALILITSLSQAEASLTALGLMDLQAIHETIEPFVQNLAKQQYTGQIKIKIRQLDSRLRLTPCSQDLQLSLPANSKLSSRFSVAVQCEGELAWTVYVPIEMQILQTALVLARPMNRGDVINAADIMAIETNIMAIDGGFFDDARHLIGKQLRQTLAMGTLLSPRFVEAPKIIKRGDIVNIVAQMPGVSVKSHGKALADATLGSRLKVENLVSKRIVEGTVLSAQEIQISM